MLFRSWVSCDVLDADGHPVATQTAACIVPSLIAIARGSYYSDELRVPTFGVHLQPGWSWRMRCIADPADPDEPLNPPVKELRPRQAPPPMYMKDRRVPDPAYGNGRAR